ncbi:hypothetical protein VMUT_2224 [Vulcanisaeta moutnovskia 768-28]|uniref:Uncharacterized protein n=1 Tax=Vulcanisaeta moutnovskia (strain 768-28) TaxID=985053 RepID=F0QXK5_VULM7|nr:hypothetical protein [Vulcanisaeta moutnovskia]ADY02420.1 hypothetical protein VMUT_2224 [Vulcanisaeta moutnovskia 768-28]
MALQGVSCPKCGSRRITIVVSDILTFKCIDCGYTWSPNLPAQGLVHTKVGDIHWTEIKKIMEDAMNYVIKILSENVISCNDIINKVQEKYGNYLTSREILRTIINGIKRYLEEIRYKDQNKYSTLSAELNRCRELISTKD